MNAADYVSDRRMLDQNIEALCTMARQRVDDGWNASLLTLTFRQIPGSPAVVVGQMGDTADRLYRAFVTRVVRRPASRNSVDTMPIFFCAPDLPVPKRVKPAGPAIALNGGMHFHGLLLTPPHSRLRTTVEEHFSVNHRLYARPPVDAIDARPITRTPELALQYVLKSIRRGRFSFDDILILPRVRRELARPFF